MSRLLAYCRPAMASTAKIAASSGTTRREENTGGANRISQLAPPEVSLPLGASTNPCTCTAIFLDRLSRHAWVSTCGPRVHFRRGDQRQLLVCRRFLFLSLVEQF